MVASVLGYWAGKGIGAESPARECEAPPFRNRRVVEAFVCGQENVDFLCFGGVKQIPIRDLVPSMPGRCFDYEALQGVSEGNSNVEAIT
jgi:hypothetical protein